MQLIPSSPNIDPSYTPYTPYLLPFLYQIEQFFVTLKALGEGLQIFFEFQK
jgi:hypothetical protein